MKFYFLILLATLTLTSCKDESEEPVKEKVKLYITASTGIYATGTPPPKMQISGTGFETVNDATNIHIIEVNYTKGEAQSVTVKGNQTETELYLKVSRGLSYYDTDRVAYQMGKGTVSVNFVAN